MIKQAFQHAELRDANDNIIQQGAYGKKSALANVTNDAWIDHVMNNLEVLHDEKASTEYVDGKVAGLVNSAPETLDTLAKLAAALGNDPNFATIIVNLIDEKCTQAKLDAHPVGSFYESTDPTSPAELFGGTWEEKIPDGELIGTVASFAGGILPSGWLLCNGSAISRETYAALFSVIGTTYGAGDGSTTFGLPDLIDRFVQGSATAGTVKSAGLPNITGGFSAGIPRAESGSASGIHFYTGSGAFLRASEADVTRYYSPAGTTTAKLNSAMTIDASRSSAIYGNSTTVQPPALTMKFAIYSGIVSKKLWLRII